MKTESGRASWKEIVRKWEKSGLSQNQFCKENNISISAFHYHRKKKNRGISFVELPEIKPAHQSIEVYLPSKDITIKVPESFCRHTLIDIFEVLGV